ncbi:MAG: hypothetical protein ABR584_07160 [Candidatus Baltobacteraceae bacterium]
MKNLKPASLRSARFCPGYYHLRLQSYCLHAGTYGPSYQCCGESNHATFQIGKDGDKIIRTVVIDQTSGHVETQIILMQKTNP